MNHRRIAVWGPRRHWDHPAPPGATIKSICDDLITLTPTLDQFDLWVRDHGPAAKLLCDVANQIGPDVPAIDRLGLLWEPLVDRGQQFTYLVGVCRQEVHAINAWVAASSRSNPSNPVVTDMVDHWARAAYEIARFALPITTDQRRLLASRLDLIVRTASALGATATQLSESQPPRIRRRSRSVPSGWHI